MVSRILRIASQQTDEFFDCKARMAQDRTQRSAVELLMVRNNHLGKGQLAAEDNVAPVLSLELESYFRERRNTLAPRNLRQARHTAMTMASKGSSGTGRPSCCNAAIYPSIASRMLATA